MTTDDAVHLIADLITGKRGKPNFFEMGALIKALTGADARQVLRGVVQAWLASDPKAAAEVRAWVGPGV